MDAGEESTYALFVLLKFFNEHETIYSYMPIISRLYIFNCGSRVIKPLMIAVRKPKHTLCSSTVFRYTYFFFLILAFGSSLSLFATPGIPPSWSLAQCLILEVTKAEGRFII